MTQNLTDAAKVWDQGSDHYDEISEDHASAIAHVVKRTKPTPADYALDVATGTGSTARRLAALGARVVGVDLSPGMIEAAKRISPHIDFQLGDAQALPFPDASFDLVVSTMGVLIAPDARKAAAEIARVTRPGGRIGLTVFPPGGVIATIFGMLSAYMPPAPPPQRFDWGRRAWLDEVLGPHFDLKVETGEITSYYDSAEAVWDMVTSGYGPIKALAETLSPPRLDQLRGEFLGYYEAHFATEMGIAFKREYWLVGGRRR